MVNLQGLDQAHAVKSLYGHQAVFSYALRYMYGDSSLSGGFFGFDQGRAKVTQEGLSVYPLNFLEPEEEQDEARAAREQRNQWYYAHTKPVLVDYARLVMTDYPAQGPVTLPDAAWLAARATPPLPAAAIPYKTPETGDAAAVYARICGMFEAAARPDYCHR